MRQPSASKAPLPPITRCKERPQFQQGIGRRTRMCNCRHPAMLCLIRLLRTPRGDFIAPSLCPKLSASLQSRSRITLTSLGLVLIIAQHHEFGCALFGIDTENGGEAGVGGPGWTWGHRAAGRGLGDAVGSGTHTEPRRAEQ